ncbi:hypothetical protein CIP101841_01040 [Corynebacterium diphtheriae]|nr:hypothetical protein CIP101841_01040 [Corynebacterium diphtheriae]CAB1011988.1 hypothetical protein FRC0515_01067 [Corynebacterium diphtheriae]CAB1037551.1 hypothetical protein FRC0547_01125 [Corynebacterium diphtheriae]
MERNIFAVISVFIAFLALGVTMVWLLQHDPLEQALKGKESPVTVTVHDVYDGEWVSVSSVCPYEDREAAADRLGMEDLNIPEEGAKDSENFIVMHAANGEYETHKYKRSAMDLCTHPFDHVDVLTLTSTPAGWEVQ